MDRDERGFKSGKCNQAVALATAMLMATLMSMPLAQAGAFDDLTRNVTQSVSDAARRGVDSVSNGISSAVSKATTPSAEAAPAANAPSAVAGPTLPGSNGCLKVKTRGDVSDLTNTCTTPTWLLYNWGSDACMQQNISPARSIIIPTAATIRGVCHNFTDPTSGPGQCACKAGNSIAEAGSTPTATEAKAGQDKLAKGVADFHKQCVTNSQLNGLHDCECLTEGYRQRAIRTASTTILPSKEQNELLQTCPASQQVTKAWVFQTCDDYMQHKRSDHVEFCSCTGERFATQYRASPLNNMRAINALKTEAMKACGLADQSHNVR